MNSRKYLFLLLLFPAIVPCFTFAQGIHLKSGQKITTTNHTVINLTQNLMGQNMEMESTVDDTKEITVDRVNKDVYELSSRTTHIKSASSVMGQEMNYDSDDSSSSNNDYADALKKQLDQVDRFSVNMNGEIDLLKDSLGPDDDVNGMIGALSIDPLQEYKVLFIPAGKKIKKGDTWTDSTQLEGIKTVTTYEVADISGNKALVDAVSVSDIDKILETQGIEVKLTMSLTAKTHSTYDLKTGLLTQSESVSEGEGKADAMNMTIPMTMKITRTSEVRN